MKWTSIKDRHAHVVAGFEPLRREFGRDKEAVSCKGMGRPKVKGRTGDSLEARATMVPDRRSTMIYLFMEIGCELQ